jgi:hypothetical protein
LFILMACNYMMMQIFHNFIRPHESLDGEKPAEVCGLKLEIFLEFNMNGVTILCLLILHVNAVVLKWTIFVPSMLDDDNREKLIDSFLSL